MLRLLKFSSLYGSIIYLGSLIILGLNIKLIPSVIALILKVLLLTNMLLTGGLWELTVMFAIRNGVSKGGVFPMNQD